MNAKIFSFLLVVVCALTSCSFFKKSDATPVERRQISSDKEFIVVNNEKFSRGGGLLVLPLTAGVDVPATDQLDRISLRIVQGMVEAIQGQPGKFKLLMADDGDAADVFVRGHITRFSATSKVTKVIPGHQRKILAVAGEVLDAKTRQVLFKFVLKRKTETAKESWEDLGLRVGTEIGGRILAAAQ